jgi:hypothetical protein
MDESKTTKAVGHRRRNLIWALFGVVGLIMGAAYATGFASTSNTIADANAGEATQLLGKPAAANPSQYANMVSSSAAPAGPLAIGFDGNYGTIASPTIMFVVDLTKNDPYGNALAGTYYSDIVLTNWAALGLDVGGSGPPKWDTLEFKFEQVTCTTPNWTTPVGSAQMHVDRVDAHVTFTGLAAGAKYCFGLNTATATTEAAALQAAAGGTIADTVMFRPNSDPTAVTPPAPQFAATVSRSA